MTGYFRDKIFSTTILLLIIGLLVSCSQPKPLSTTVSPDLTLAVPAPSKIALTGTSTNTADASSTTIISHVNRTIEFAGYIWNVKSGCGFGPGPNCWSDSADSVWLQDGELHLKMRKFEDQWYSAEVSTIECTQYGMHRFFVDSNLSLLDKNVVAAMFLYKDDQHEIDMEFSKWVEENPEENAQFVIQPWDISGNMNRFTIPQGATESTHTIDWESSSIKFTSYQGDSRKPLTPDNLLVEWEYTGNYIPTQDGCLKVHINLWQVGGHPPSDGQDVELVVTGAQLPDPYQPPPSPIHPSSTPNSGSAESPKIEITRANVDLVEGLISPVVYCNDDYRVVLYAKTDIWYVQFDIANPRTMINSTTCNWGSPTHPWEKLAVYLVSKNYNPPAVLSSQSCPPELSDPEVLASTCFNP